MNTPEMPEMNKMTQLAQTFSAACEKAVTEGKVVTRAAPLVAAAVVVLPADATTIPRWA